MKHYRVKKGYNVPLAGAPAPELADVAKPGTVALRAQDFLGMKGRLLHKEGDTVKIGTPIVEWKAYPEVKFCAPGGGKIVQVNYGPRRKMLEIVIELDESEQRESVDALSEEAINDLKREQIKERLCAGGLWPLIIRRPFGKIAFPDVQPDAVFVNAMNTAPCAPDPFFLVKDQMEKVALGLKILMKLAGRCVYLNVPEELDPTVLAKAGIAERPNLLEIASFSGPHPAGLTGTHMQHIRPLRAKETYWSLRLQDLALIADLFTTGEYPIERTYALTGPAVTNPQYFRSRLGVPVAALTGIQVKSGHHRYISGNVLDGDTISAEGYVGYYANQVTVLEEGDRKELFGWMMPGFSKLTRTGVYVSSLLPIPRSWSLHTNLNGARRPFITDDFYDDVVAVDIIPSELFKAIMTEDIEAMEKMGVRDCIEEDVALCTFICPSKIPFGEILREGLELYEKEG